jgi:LAS superfamily LD-carboxypeptidase LdcB
LYLFYIEKTSSYVIIKKEVAMKKVFIVRYKEGWGSIAGYIVEPYHLRYIGDGENGKRFNY